MTDTREKLIEILKTAPFGGEPLDYWWFEEMVANFADHLIANGVTLNDGKPLEAFLHPIDTYKGLKAKYFVFKADSGKKVENCFVLRPDKDPAVAAALRTYARATDNEVLSADIFNWVGQGEEAR